MIVRYSHNNHGASSRARGNVLNQIANIDKQRISNILQNQLDVSTSGLSFRISHDRSRLHDHILGNVNSSANICAILGQMIYSGIGTRVRIFNNTVLCSSRNDDLQSIGIQGQRIASGGRNLYTNLRIG